MNRTEYIAKIKAAYEGELYGEAWFEAMARQAVTQDVRHKFAAMARLELETQGHLAPLVKRLGIVGVDTAAQREKGIQLAQQNGRLSWQAFVTWFAAEIERFVVLYDEMASEGPEEDAAVLTQLARHERALLEFARLEAAGMPDRSIEPVLALLAELSNCSMVGLPDPTSGRLCWLSER